MAGLPPPPLRPPPRPPPRPLLLLLAALCVAGAGGEGDAVPMLGLQGGSGGAAGGAKDAMTELLHWGLEHSDPAKLAEIMKRYQEQNLTFKDVYDQEVIDALFRDEASDMLRLIAVVADFRNASLSDEVLEGALAQLQEYIDQVDNAGNLHRMGGLAPLLELALDPASRGPEPRALALWTLGVAAQNNPPVQADLLSLDGLGRLAAWLPRCGGAPRAEAGEGGAGLEDGVEDLQFCGKLLFALSSLVKNNAATQAAADGLGVFDWLFREGIGHGSTAVAKKSLGTLETVLAQSPELPVVDALPPRQAELAAALLQHVRGQKAGEVDVDLTEKALRLVNRLLSLRPFLFGPGFGPDLAAAAADATQRCEASFGAGDEICSGLSSLAAHANIMLTANDISDAEL